MKALHQFEFNFVCEPFAYGADVRESIQYGSNNVPYNGTYEAPSVITIKNTGTTAINNLRITTIRKEVQ